MFNNQIIYGKDRFSIFAEYKKVEEHKHYAKHILVADEPFVSTVEGCAYYFSGVFIQSNVFHSIDYRGDFPVFMMLIDESSELSDKINDLYLKDKSVMKLPDEVYREASQYVKTKNLKGLDEFLIDSLFDLDGNKGLDVRIKAVLDYIDTLECIENDLFKEMSSKSSLSESRFSHLFKSELGVDFKNFVLLKKFEKTFKNVLMDNMSITDACIRAGFSSSSHFSSACKNHFGISLRDFMKYQHYK